jgi:hypothetical protein
MTITFQSATSSRSILKIELQNIFWRTEALPKDIESITGFTQSIGGKTPAIQKTRDGRVNGNRGKTIKRVEVRFKFKGLAVVRESTVTLSGSIPWEMMYRVLVRLVPEAKQLTFNITNTAVRFYLKKSVRLDSIATEGAKNSSYKLIFEPELGFSRLTIRFSYGVVANIFANGTVVAQGRDLTGIESKIKNLLSKYRNPYGANKKTNPIPTRKNLKAKRLRMAENRYEAARSWNNERAGYYVRPGPNKVPRFYGVPKNPALVRTKVLRAYSNIGINVPNKVKQLLGITSVRVKPKAIIKKTTKNWDANAPNGMYIRPGPGGLPKLYKIPKSISQGKKTVIEAYKKAGVNVPNKVKQIFKIVNSTRSKNNTHLKTNFSRTGKFRIDGLECMRYKLEDLKKIAQKLDIPTLRQTKEALCREIRKKAVPTVTKNLKENFVKNGVSYTIIPDEKRVLRNKRSRTMNSFKIKNLKNMILKLNNSSNVSNKKKSQLIELLIERKRTMNMANAMFNNFSPSSSSSSSVSSSPSPASSPRRNPLNIARNILGPNFTNSELTNFLERYKKSPTRLNQIVAEFKQPKLRRMASANVEVL